MIKNWEACGAVVCWLGLSWMPSISYVTTYIMKMECFLWVRNWDFKYYSQDLRASKVSKYTFSSWYVQVWSLTLLWGWHVQIWQINWFRFWASDCSAHSLVTILTMPSWFTSLSLILLSNSEAVGNSWRKTYINDSCLICSIQFCVKYLMLSLTFSGLCIMKYLHNKDQQAALFFFFSLPQ